MSREFLDLDTFIALWRRRLVMRSGGAEVE